MLRSVNKIRIGFDKRENAMFLFGNTFGCARLAARNGTGSTKPCPHSKHQAKRPRAVEIRASPELGLLG